MLASPPEQRKGRRKSPAFWQPEGFVFPSMLTTSLFMASLCLILVIFTSFLDARKSWKPVLQAAGPSAARTGCSDIAMDPANPEVLDPEGQLRGILDETVLVTHLVRTERPSLALPASAKVQG
mgnify:CR=1 FL=1